MGHSGEMALSTYLHVMSDLGDERVSAEEAIRRARANSDVPISYLSERRGGEAVSGLRHKKPSRSGAFVEVGDPGLEPGTSSLSEKRSNRLS